MNSVGRILLLAVALTAAATLACRDSDDAAPAPSPTTAVVDSTSPATDTPSPAAPAAQSAASPTGIWVAGRGDHRPRTRPGPAERRRGSPGEDGVRGAQRGRRRHGRRDSGRQTPAVSPTPTSRPPRSTSGRGTTTSRAFRPWPATGSPTRRRSRCVTWTTWATSSTMSRKPAATRRESTGSASRSRTRRRSWQTYARLPSRTRRTRRNTTPISLARASAALFYLTETGGASPPTPVARAELGFADSSARAATSVSGGELTLRMTIQAAFALE